MACFLTSRAADLYDAAMGVFTARASMLPLAAHTLVYEELVADPRRPCVRWSTSSGSIGVRRCSTTAHGHVAWGDRHTRATTRSTEPLSKVPSGRWRRYEKQLAPVLPVLLPWAERLGYSD